jgi:predicted RNA binding protein YcfA (HicA-like mRNA interferase family)
MAGAFPSMKANDLLKVLTREPLNYAIVRQQVSHRRLKAQGRPTLTFAFHAKRTLAPGEVRDVLVKDAGLDVDEARGLV